MIKKKTFFLFNSNFFLQFNELILSIGHNYTIVVLQEFINQIKPVFLLASEGIKQTFNKNYQKKKETSYASKNP